MSLPKIGHRKIILVFFLLFLLGFVSAQIAKAAYLPSPGGTSSPGQMPVLLQQVKEEYEAEDINLGQFTRYLVDKMANAGTHALIGVPVIEGQEGPGGGAFGGAITLIASLYANPPASSIDYLADIGHNLGLASPAYAQGTGWYALQPMLKIWRLFRNIAYLFLVVVFVAVGFMIMFRAKIDPQTVASIQNALPQLIVALILITFSYALAGLMFDLMEFGMNVVSILLKGPTPLVACPPGECARGPESWNLFQLINESFGGTVDIGQINIPKSGLLTLINMMQGILTAFGAQTTIAQFIIAIVLVFTAFKLFFALLGRYISFLLATIFGPLLLLLSAIPGRGDFVFLWFKTLLKAVLAFPAVYAVLAIAAVISEASDWRVVAPMTEPLQAPRMLYYVFNDSSLIKNLIGFGMLLVSPSIPDMIDQVFEKRPGPPAFAAAAQTIRGVIGRMPIVGGLAAGI